MKFEQQFFRCELCGNIIMKLVDAKTNVSCCGQEMMLLSPNTVDASLEKHIPNYISEDGKLKVQVGSIVHPMIDEHYIQFILATDDDVVLYKKLSPGEEPAINLDIDMNKMATSYEYCNLHGLWKGTKS